MSPLEDSPDTAHSSIVTDHHFVPKEDAPWERCQYPGCALSEAAHATGPIEDTDPGRPASMRHKVSDIPPPLQTYWEGMEARKTEEAAILKKQEEDEVLRDREEVMRAEGHKDDYGKTAYSTLPWEALEIVAQVMQFGAQKYAPGNYRKGMAHRRLFDACVRHMKDWWKGEELDPESGLPHTAHAVCCLLMLLEMDIIGSGDDNRFANPKNENSADPPNTQPS